MSSLGIVVPAFQPDIEQLERYLHDLQAELTPETIRVEIDDPSEACVRRLSALDGSTAEVSAVPYRRGKGAAITAGFEALSTDQLAFTDADGSTSAAELARVIDALESADIAVGSRRHPESTIVGHRTYVRRLLGDGFAWLARRALEPSLYDYQCGAKALDGESWERIRPHIYEPGFAWDLEALAVAGALGLDIREIPIVWEDQPGSTVSPVKTTISMAKSLAVTRYRAKRLQNSSFHHAVHRGSEPIALIDRNR
ncbi:MAG: glycosyltransferase [Natronomonas sp.]|uniref:glycosyltransferase n=1 Tax=Natronomonas sp. TaxID=2184060 RepID=UPI00286FF04E|nr:glycosyltransferase [Natronomonas sp.]MDR9380135.1 glycosyltransferase [Natronomonas sp.]MDR9430136.1 glycosyltransferase [Natronomonas sp.]